VSPKLPTGIGVLGRSDGVISTMITAKDTRENAKPVKLTYALVFHLVMIDALINRFISLMVIFFGR
jgi:hypothetical protein